MRTRLVMVGGGLANSLAAYRLATTRDDVELIVLERDDVLGGNHVWSFHQSDLTQDQHRWIAPFVDRSWPHYEVRFPGLQRRLGGGYYSATSERLHRVVSAALGDCLRLGSEVATVAPQRVVFADGSTLTCDATLDGRGSPGDAPFTVAYQKFVGQMLELDADHGLEGPLLMDATVEQRDGFRFFYALPFDARSVFVEDTRYSDTDVMDLEELRSEIGAYATERGWRVKARRREEVGALPIVLAGDIEALWDSDRERVPRSGMRAALFHPTTGYSLPQAVRFADALAKMPDLGSETLYRWARERSIRSWRRGRYFRFLNRMLFRAAEPSRRYLVMQRFYGLPEGLIRRFYAGRLTLADRVRILTGKPPVPVSRALRCLRGAPGLAVGPQD